MAISTFWTTRWRQLSKSLSLRAGLYCFGACAAALAAIFFSPYVPDSLAELLGGEAADRLLMILASSMLAVVTFSLSTLVASYATVTGSAPPRATSLIMDDSRAQNALSTFLGAFIFSIVSLVALSTHYYGEKGRVILFLITVAVLASVIWTIIRWIGQLSGLGRLTTVIDQVETATSRAIAQSPHSFCWGPQPPRSSMRDGVPVHASRTGFVQTIDLQALSNLLGPAEASERSELEVLVMAGAFVFQGQELARVSHASDEEAVIRKIRSCFVIGRHRTFETDPRFGFVVLSEIGSRALSPGINDPGTAIQVLGSLFRLLEDVKNARAAQRVDDRRALSERLRYRRVTALELFDDAFRGIARDGASCAEVVIFLQKGLQRLREQSQFKAAAEFSSQDSLARAKLAMSHAHDLARAIAAAQTPIQAGDPCTSSSS